MRFLSLTLAMSIISGICFGGDTAPLPALDTAQHLTKKEDGRWHTTSSSWWSRSRPLSKGTHTLTCLLEGEHPRFVLVSLGVVDDTKMLYGSIPGTSFLAPHGFAPRIAWSGDPLNITRYATIEIKSGHMNGKINEAYKVDGAIVEELPVDACVMLVSPIGLRRFVIKDASGWWAEIGAPVLYKHIADLDHHEGVAPEYYIIPGPRYLFNAPALPWCSVATVDSDSE